MIQRTSLDAYSKVAVNYRQRQILEIFKRNWTRNFTNRELAEKLCWDINRVTPRVLELRKKGVLKKDIRRKCSVTGNGAYAWCLNL